MSEKDLDSELEELAKIMEAKDLPEEESGEDKEEDEDEKDEEKEETKT